MSGVKWSITKDPGVIKPHSEKDFILVNLIAL